MTMVKIRTKRRQRKTARKKKKIKKFLGKESELKVKKMQRRISSLMIKLRSCLQMIQVPFKRDMSLWTVQKWLKLVF
jgi:hypothetical protein